MVDFHHCAIRYLCHARLSIDQLFFEANDQMLCGLGNFQCFDFTYAGNIKFPFRIHG